MWPVDGHHHAALDRRRPARRWRRRSTRCGRSRSSARAAGHPPTRSARRRAARDCGPSTMSKPSLGATSPTSISVARAARYCGGDLRRCAGGAERPVKSIADPSANPQRAAVGRAGYGLRLPASARDRARGEVDRLDRGGRRHRACRLRRRCQRRDAQRLPLPLLVCRNLRGARKRRPGHVLHSRASTPALFQPGRAPGGRASAQRVRGEAHGFVTSTRGP